MMISSTALVCDCHDFSFIKHVRIDSTHLDLSDAFCNASRVLHCENVKHISLDDLVCETTVDCPDGCNCTDQPSTMSMIINCTNADLKDLPNKLPLLNSPGYKYRLDLTNNAIFRLDNRDYLENTSSLDVSNSAVEEIDSGIWKAFQSMDEIGLKNNLLTQLPGSWEKIQIKGKLNIQNNPFACNCDNQWLKDWLKRMSSKIVNPVGINCNTSEWLKGKSVILLEDREFCSGPPKSKADVVGMSILSISLTLVLCSIVVFILRNRQFRLKLYEIAKLHTFDQDECVGEDMEYDVFVSISTKDEEFAQSLITFLEDGECKVCYHDTDFEPGREILDNIIESVNRSKRVLCFLTRDFIESRYCMEEFRIAHQRDLDAKKQRLILLSNEPVQNFRDDENTCAEMRDYLNRYTCIEKGNSDWQNQVMYAMPGQRLLKADMPSHRIDSDIEMLVG